MYIIFKRLFFLLFFLIDKVIKKEDVIIFTSFKEMTDNSFAIYKYLLKNNYNYKYIWIRNSRNKELQMNKNIKIYPYKSIRGLYYYLKAKYVFETHGMYRDFPHNKNRVRVNLWHGMPLKAIGNLDRRIEKKIKSNDDILIATSKFFQKIMSEAFGVVKEKVIITGQPRNDLLFEKTNYFKKNHINIFNFKKILMWVPTFRNSIVSSNEVWARDGIFNEKKISILDFEELENINKLLLSKHFLLIIKLHPFDILQKEIFQKFTNIIILKNQDLEKVDEQLYPLLGSADALITDFSSVWIDYEILNKPIFFAIHDYEEYKNSRGLLFEDFIDISPYPVIKNIKEFINFLKNYESIEMNIKKVTNKYNEYKDNNSSKRIVEYLKIKKRYKCEKGDN